MATALANSIIITFVFIPFTSCLNSSYQEAEPYFHIYCYPDIYTICLFKK